MLFRTTDLINSFNFSELNATGLIDQICFAIEYTRDKFCIWHTINPHQDNIIFFVIHEVCVTEIFVSLKCENKGEIVISNINFNSVCSQEIQIWIRIYLVTIISNLDLFKKMTIMPTLCVSKKENCLHKRHILRTEYGLCNLIWS